jgi:hypothetical protein
VEVYLICQTSEVIGCYPIHDRLFNRLHKEHGLISHDGIDHVERRAWTEDGEGVLRLVVWILNEYFKSSFLYEEHVFREFSIIDQNLAWGELPNLHFKGDGSNAFLIKIGEEMYISYAFVKHEEEVIFVVIDTVDKLQPCVWEVSHERVKVFFRQRPTEGFLNTED